MPRLPIYLTPGPTKVHPEIMDWIRQAETEGVWCRSHRSPWFGDLYEQVKAELRALLGIPAKHTIAFLTSSNEAWERSIESLVDRKSFHFVSGEFGKRWSQFARNMGRQTDEFTHDHLYSGDFSEVRIPSDCELICMTHNETSTGFTTPESVIHQIGAAYSRALLAVDIVSSVPNVNLDWRRIDVAHFSVTKGFNLPAGLSVVILSPRAIERSRELRAAKGGLGAYHSFDQLASSSALGQTAETPNVLGAYLLTCTLAKLNRQARATIISETASRMSGLTGAMIEIGMPPLVSHAPYRSLVGAAFLLPSAYAGEAPGLIAKLAKRNLFVGGCYDELKPRAIRVANFPAHTKSEHEELVSALRDVLTG